MFDTIFSLYQNIRYIKIRYRELQLYCIKKHQNICRTRDQTTVVSFYPAYYTVYTFPYFQTMLNTKIFLELFPLQLKNSKFNRGMLLILLGNNI